MSGQRNGAGLQQDRTILSSVRLSYGCCPVSIVQIKVIKLSQSHQNSCRSHRSAQQAGQIGTCGWFSASVHVFWWVPRSLVSAMMSRLLFISAVLKSHVVCLPCLALCCNAKFASHAKIMQVVVFDVSRLTTITLHAEPVKLHIVRFTACCGDLAWYAATSSRPFEP